MAQRVGMYGHGAPRGRAPRGHGSRGGLRVPLIIGAALVAVIVGVVATHAYSSTPSGSATGTLPASTTPITVTSFSPPPNGAALASNATVEIHFDAAVDPHSAMPTWSPPVAGRWKLLNPTTLAFTPSAPFVPSQSYTLQIPQGPSGLLGTKGQLVAGATTATFTVQNGSTLRLQQLLAELGYLPVNFVPNSPAVAPQDMAEPQQGSFTWRWPTPAPLQALWAPGVDNTMTKGAIMAFESVEGLPTDGIAGPEVWSYLLKAIAQHKVNPRGYNWIYVTETPQPELLHLWHDGSYIIVSKTNTGISASPTPLGTFTVYAHYRSVLMQGRNPNGTPYYDPHVPWVAYFHAGGFAVHGFYRASYGFPQSLGCVELPIRGHDPIAEQVWQYDHVGTLVTIVS